MKPNSKSSGAYWKHRVHIDFPENVHSDKLNIFPIFELQMLRNKNF